jgi:glutamate-1-semialdehyde 2,1-aminomutase
MSANSTGFARQKPPDPTEIGVDREVLAILVTAFRHDMGRDLELPTKAFAAAARATLRVARETDVAGHVSAMGLRLREGLASLAKEHGIAIRQSGPPQMPLMLFETDPEIRKGRAFCSAALRHGAFFHPQHNMVLSLAHRPADIDEALQAASYGFKAVREQEARSNR